jgi:hypothetical protein
MYQRALDGYKVPLGPDHNVTRDAEEQVHEAQRLANEVMTGTGLVDRLSRLQLTTGGER